MAAFEGRFGDFLSKGCLAAKIDLRVVISQVRMFPIGVQKGSTMTTHLYDLYVILDRRAKAGVGESPLRDLLPVYHHKLQRTPAQIRLVKFYSFNRHRCGHKEQGAMAMRIRSLHALN